MLYMIYDYHVKINFILHHRLKFCASVHAFKDYHVDNFNHEKNKSNRNLSKHRVEIRMYLESTLEMKIYIDVRQLLVMLIR
jgi:hypothetical protein